MRRAWHLQIGNSLTKSLALTRLLPGLPFTPSGEERDPAVTRGDPRTGAAHHYDGGWRDRVMRKLLLTMVLGALVFVVPAHAGSGEIGVGYGRTNFDSNITSESGTEYGVR